MKPPKLWGLPSEDNQQIQLCFYVKFPSFGSFLRSCQTTLRLRRLYMLSLRFYILSNIVIYTFLRFYMLSYAFHTLSYTFIRFLHAFIHIQTQRSKTSPPLAKRPKNARYRKAQPLRGWQKPLVIAQQQIRSNVFYLTLATKRITP